MPDVAPLTPFVATLQQAAVDAALRFAGLDAGAVRCRIERRRDGPVKWVVRFEFTSADARGLNVELFDGRTPGPAWFRTARFGVSYRRLRDGSEPVQHPELARGLAALRARLSALDGPAGAPEAAALAQALEAYVPFLGIEDGMFRQVSAGHGGAVATLRLGFRCNQNCAFCWQARDWPEPPTELYLRWLDEMAAAGVRSLSITGGEPTLHPQLPEIIERAARVHRMKPGLQTNAVRLRKEPYLRRLVDAGLDDVFVSWHSPDAAVSDAMTRAPGTWEGTVAGIEACLAAGVPVRVNCVVERANLAQLPDHARMAVERFVRPWPENPLVELTYTFPHAYFDREGWRRALAPLDEVRPLLLSAARTLLAAGVAVQATGTCGFPPCVVAEEPSLARFVDTRHLDALDASARGHADACSRCAARERCLGVRNEYVELYGDRGLAPFAAMPGKADSSAPRK